MDLNTSLYKADRELVSHGITTIFHSLSVYGAHIFDHKPIRDFGNVSALIDRVAGLRAGEGARPPHPPPPAHARGADSVDLYDDIEAFLRSGKVDLVSFMDHTPGQGQYATSCCSATRSRATATSPTTRCATSSASSRRAAR